MKKRMEFDSSKEAPDFDRPHIPEDLYTGTLDEVQEFESEYGKGLRLIYLIDGKDVKLTHLCSIPKEVNPENKLGRIFLAHGVELGGKVTVDQIIGTKARVMVEDVKKKDNKGNDIVFSGITKVKKIE